MSIILLLLRFISPIFLGVIGTIIGIFINNNSHIKQSKKRLRKMNSVFDKIDQKKEIDKKSNLTREDHINILSKDDND